MRGWLGVGIQELSEELAENFGVKTKQGVLINQVYEDSPADKAGLKSGDIIVAVNQKKIRTVRDLTGKIASLPPESKAELTVVRGGNKRTFSVVLGEREKGEALAMGGSAGGDETGIGLTVTALTPALARKLGVDENLRGVVIKEIDASSPAAGIVREGDIILEINRKRVSDVDSFSNAISKRDKAKGILMRVQKGSAQIFVVVK